MLLNQRNFGHTFGPDLTQILGNEANLKDRKWFVFDNGCGKACELIPNDEIHWILTDVDRGN